MIKFRLYFALKFLGQYVLPYSQKGAYLEGLGGGQRTGENFREFLKNRSPRHSIYFHPTDPYEVGSLIGKGKLKDSFGIDGISSRVLKHLPPNFIIALSILFNKSMAQGVFPTKFKKAKVVPIYKKKGSRKHVEQYRPISLLCSLSKILEKLIHKRVSNFLEKQNFFPKTQLGF